MISVYRDGRNGLQPADGFPAGSWVHVEEPTEDELRLLHQEMGVPETFLAAAVDPREVARTHTQQGIHLAIVRVPYDFGPQDRIPFRTTPLAMLITPNHFITVCRHPIDFVHDLTYSYDETEVRTRRANRMILAILGVVGQWFLRYLDELDRRMEDVEDRLADSIENSEMLELLRYEKSLIYIKTGLQWNEQMVRHLQERAHFEWTAEDLEMLSDVEIEYRQGFYMASTMQAVLGEMTDAFASLISNNLNVVMKFLAAITIVLTVPMIFSSLYGMNVGLPGEGSRSAFLALVLLSAVSAGVVAWWFYRRGWLTVRWHRGHVAGHPHESGSGDGTPRA